MTVRELYDEIGGNYDQAIRVMKMDKLIDKHIRRLKNSSVFDAVFEAGESMDPVRLFESTHAMKGMCANLGLDKLAECAAKITENYRPGSTQTLSDDEVKDILDEIKRLYQITIDGIDRYEAQA